METKMETKIELTTGEMVTVRECWMYHEGIYGSRSVVEIYDENDEYLGEFNGRIPDADDYILEDEEEREMYEDRMNWFIRQIEEHINY